MSLMSMPSISTRPRSGSKTRCSRLSVVDFPDPVAPTSAIVFARRHVEANVADRRPLAVIEKDTLSNVTRPSSRPASLAPGWSRTPGSVSSTSKNSRSFGIAMNQPIGEAHHLIEPAISMIAKFMNMTISPIVARPCR